jgi:hypothetical protein
MDEGIISLDAQAQRLNAQSTQGKEIAQGLLERMVLANKANDCRTVSDTEPDH